MKKIALCFFGLAESLNGNAENGALVDFRIGYYYNMINVMTKNTDVFIHTWSVNSKEELIQKYKPKKYIFEKQRFFSEDRLMNCNYSRWFSHNQVLSLCKNYEKNNNFKYDFIMILRFDICILTKLNFDELNSNFLYFSHVNYFYDENNLLESDSCNKKYYIKCVDCGVVNHKAENMNQLSDLYFLGGSDIMNNLLNIENISYSNHRTIFYILQNKNILNKVKFLLFRGLDLVLTRRKFLKSYVEEKFKNKDKYYQYNYTINLYSKEYFELIFKIIKELNIDISYDNNHFTFEEFLNIDITKIVDNCKYKKVKEILPYLNSDKNLINKENIKNNLIIQNCHNIINFKNFILIKQYKDQSNN